MVGTIVHQLTDGASSKEIEEAGMQDYYTDHGWGVYPQAAQYISMKCIKDI